MNNNGIFRMFIAVGLSLAGQVRAADPNIDAVLRVIDRRMQIDASANWLGAASGTFSSVSYYPDGSGASLEGDYSVIYSRTCCCVAYNIPKNNKALRLIYIIAPDSAVTVCAGSFPVSSVDSLPFDPFVIVQRPNLADKINYGMGYFWLSRIEKVFDVQVAPEQISMSLRGMDSKLVYVVDNTEEHRGRILSFAAHDGNPSGGYSEPHHAIEYVYHADGTYPDEVRETIYEWALPADNEKPTLRVKKTVAITVTSYTRGVDADDCSCESFE